MTDEQLLRMALEVLEDMPTGALSTRHCAKAINVIIDLRERLERKGIGLLPCHRRHIEEAIKAAEHPSGMSVHDGMARVRADVLRRLLEVSDD